MQAMIRARGGTQTLIAVTDRRQERDLPTAASQEKRTAALTRCTTSPSRPTPLRLSHETSCVLAGSASAVAVLAAFLFFLAPALAAGQLPLALPGGPRCELPGGTVGVPEEGIASQAAPRAVPNPNAPADLPDRVHLRGAAETFNRQYYFALRAGSLWFKPNVEATSIDGGWGRVPTPDCLDGRMTAISADDDELVALGPDRRIFLLDRILADPALWNWSTRWGDPFWTGDGWFVPEDIRAWDWSVVSPREDVTWLDPAGNDHQIGEGKVSHIWLLSSDGQRFTYLDPWLPRDYSYRMCGPHRGRFQAVAMASSGSTLFIVNEHGDFFTRVYDFDIAGSDPVFFSYSYEDQRSVANPRIQLPGVPWVVQPKIDGEITDRISIHKRETGVVDRTLRVEGSDADGHTGYWEKEIGAGSAHPWINATSAQVDPVAPGASAEWTFHRTGALPRGAVLDNRAHEDTSDDTLGPDSDRLYSRNMTARDGLVAADGLTGPDDWAAELLDFNLACSPATLRVWVGSQTSIDLLLHTTDTIRQTPAAADLDDEPRGLRGAIEVPEPLWLTLADQSTAVQDFVAAELGGRRFTEEAVRASLSMIEIPELGWIFTDTGTPPGPPDCGELQPLCNAVEKLTSALSPADALLDPLDDETARSFEPPLIALREVVASIGEIAAGAAAAGAPACPALAPLLDELRAATDDLRTALAVAADRLAGGSSVIRPQIDAALADVDRVREFCGPVT